MPSKPVTDCQQISIHDDLNEAISTSLTSTPSLREIPSRTSVLNIPQSELPSLSPTTSRFPAGFSPSSSNSIPFTSTPVDLPQPDADAASINENHDRKSSRQSWTSGLWVWGNKKNSVTKRSSMGSVASVNQPVPPSPNAIPRSTPEHEDEDEAWRKGDGGSSPSYRAIFLATVSVSASSAVHDIDCMRTAHTYSGPFFHPCTHRNAAKTSYCPTCTFPSQQRAR